MSDTTATPKSKWFRVAVEGATASDGRTIERNWLLEMAASYNPATFGARVNMEHIKGYSAEGPFIAYGDVLAVRTEEVEIGLAGKTEKRLALYAQIDPTDQLIKFNKARQKIYTSIEIEPNFAGTGKCYLMGLAVTDNPASLGTEALKFTAKTDNEFAKQLKAALDARKQHATSLFSALIETTIEFEAAPPADADTLAYHFVVPRKFLLDATLNFIPRAIDGAVPLLVQMTYVPALALGGEGAATLWALVSGWAAAASATDMAKLNDVFWTGKLLWELKLEFAVQEMRCRRIWFRVHSAI